VKASGMKFTVTTPTAELHFDGGYRLESSGALTVKGEGGNNITFSPVGWLSVEITEGGTGTFATFA
jgi:hypothetical protein